MVNKLKIKCRTCQKEFESWPSDNRKFCSHPCYSKSIKENQINKTHGLSKTRFYRIWRGMVNRCNNKNELAYKSYGGRGIKLLWESIEDFKRDMYESYLEHVDRFGEKRTQIDRIDNNGHYCKENCRWATQREQARNRKSRREVTFKGKTQSVKEWSEETGIPNTALWLRLYRYKWPIERALSEPVGKYHNHPK